MYQYLYTDISPECDNFFSDAVFYWALRVKIFSLYFSDISQKTIKEQQQFVCSKEGFIKEFNDKTSLEQHILQNEYTYK